jgi:hypothetical protein
MIGEGLSVWWLFFGGGGGGGVERRLLISRTDRNSSFNHGTLSDSYSVCVCGFVPRRVVTES